MPSNIKEGLKTTPGATKQKEVVKSPTTTNNSKFWRLYWESYALDPDEDGTIPLETRETVHPTKPSPSMLYQLRKHAHGMGFKLVDLVEIDPSLDEF